MKRNDLEHIIRAAGSITNCHDIIIIGSQSILGRFPTPPLELTVSQEADIFPATSAVTADLIDGTIGERSPFHETFGYYAHGVGEETAILPKGWRDRLIPIVNENTMGFCGLCLDPVDCAVSKLAAGRPRDLDFVNTLLSYHMVSPHELRSSIELIADPFRGQAITRFDKIVQL